MMSLRTPLLTLTLITLFMSLGVDGTEWSVKYNPTEICVLKGSTVFINGTFTYPKDHEVTDTFWVIDPVKDVESLDLYKRTEFSGRIHYLGDKQQNFSFRLSNVTNDDQHMYCFRVSVNTPVKTDKYLYYPGVQLHITELHVNILPEVTERETAVLNCTTTCSLTDSPTLIWYKNGRRLSSNTNPLHLQPVSSEDAGSYMCAVRGYEHLPSPAQTLTVRYPPKNVSISPSGQIVEESSVTLTCSSDANPPVQNYTWFKEGGTSPEGSGQNYIIISSGWYYCVAQNEHGVLKSASTDITLKGDTQTAGHFYILPVAVGVGICGIVLPLSVVLFMKRQSLRRYKKQRRNPDESVYENVGLKPCPTCDTSTFSSPVYENTAALRKHH